MSITIPDNDTTVVDVGSVDNVNTWVQLDTTFDHAYRRILYVKTTDDAQLFVTVDGVLDGETYDSSNQGIPITANENFSIRLPSASGKAFLTCPTADAEAFVTVITEDYR